MSAAMRQIAGDVAARYQLTLEDVRGKSRLRAVAWPRQEVMTALVDSGRSYAAVGRFLGRDHTTILFGVKAARLRQPEQRSRPPSTHKERRRQRQDDARAEIVAEERKYIKALAVALAKQEAA